MIKALIIDDEGLARENLRKRIQSIFPNIEILDEIGNISDAYYFLQSNNPDIVFLDINMPGGSGFDLLKRLNKISFEIIFVTAYDRFAIKAFEFNALGYLLNPIHPEQFYQVVQNCVDRIDTQKQNSVYKKVLSNFSQQKSAAINTQHQ